MHLFRGSLPWHPMALRRCFQHSLLELEQGEGVNNAEDLQGGVFGGLSPFLELLVLFLVALVCET